MKKTIGMTALLFLMMGLIGCNGETANIEFLEANGLEYNIVKVYDNGVRVGVIRTNGRISTIFPDAASQP